MFHTIIKMSKQNFNTNLVVMKLLSYRSDIKVDPMNIKPPCDFLIPKIENHNNYALVLIFEKIREKEMMNSFYIAILITRNTVMAYIANP